MSCVSACHLWVLHDRVIHQWYICMLILLQTIAGLLSFPHNCEATVLEGLFQWLSLPQTGVERDWRVFVVTEVAEAWSQHLNGTWANISIQLKSVNCLSWLPTQQTSGHLLSSNRWKSSCFLVLAGPSLMRNWCLKLAAWPFFYCT